MRDQHRGICSCLIVALAALLLGCGRIGYRTVDDTGVQALGDASVEAALDAPTDRGTDVGADVAAEIATGGAGQTCMGLTCQSTLGCVDFNPGSPVCVFCGNAGQRCCGTQCSAGLQCLQRSGHTWSYCVDPMRTVGAVGGPCTTMAMCDGNQACLALTGGNYCTLCGVVGSPCCPRTGVADFCSAGSCMPGTLYVPVCQP